MFFDMVILLPQHRHRLSNSWIAATRGIRFLKRHVIAETDVVSICENIAEVLQTHSQTAKMRFSLRLSSILINGTCRIHKQQVNLIIESVSKFLTTVQTPSILRKEAVVKPRKRPMKKDAPIEGTPVKKKMTSVSAPPPGEESITEMINAVTSFVMPRIIDGAMASRLDDITLREEQPLGRGDGVHVGELGDQDQPLGSIGFIEETNLINQPMESVIEQNIPVINVDKSLLTGSEATIPDELVPNVTVVPIAARKRFPTQFKPKSLTKKFVMVNYKYLSYKPFIRKLARLNIWEELSMFEPMSTLLIPDEQPRELSMSNEGRPGSLAMERSNSITIGRTQMETPFIDTPIITMPQEIIPMEVIGVETPIIPPISVLYEEEPRRRLFEDAISSVSLIQSEEEERRQKKRLQCQGIALKLSDEKIDMFTIEQLCELPINKKNIATTFLNLISMSWEGYVKLITEEDSTDLAYIQRGPKFDQA